LAQVAAQEFEDLRAQARADRERHRRWLQAERDRLEFIEGLTVGVLDRVGRLFGVAMIAAGYELHRRQWRKRRKSMLTKELDSPPFADIARRFREGNVPEDLVEIGRQIAADVGRHLDLSERAARGDQGAIVVIRGLFDRDEAGVLVQVYRGDLAHEAEEALITSMTDNPLWQEALRRQAARLRAQLAGDSSTVIERLLAESAALAWLEFYFASTFRYQFEARMTPQMRNSHQRRQDRAHRRLLQSLKALSTVRATALSVVQVRVDQNISVGAPPAPTDHLDGRGNLAGVLATRAGRN
jgi:hypothetical protein